jgi:GntR family transcriptional repressor for pyruvate dehydrogenase complex
MADPHRFEPVVQTRASSGIADQLRAAILDGHYRTGQRLLERELAEQFGVSRMTVRDALRTLEAMQLIEIRLGARGGAFVTVPTGDVMSQTMLNLMKMWAVAPEDVVEARLVMEIGTVTLACVRATAADLERLRDQVALAREDLAAGTYKRERSWEFHTLLARAAGNGAVEGLTHSFDGTLARIPARGNRRAAAQTIEEHVRIVDALERRDARAARAEMAQHLIRGTKLEGQADALAELWSEEGTSRPG